MKQLAVSICWICLASLGFGQEARIPVPINDPGDRFELIGKLGIPLGELATVRGVAIEGPEKGYEGGPNLLVQMINGKPTQRHIRIPMTPYFYDFQGKSRSRRKKPFEIVNGSTYRMLAYETGGFVGIPPEAYKAGGIPIQTTGFYFRNSLTVFPMEKTNPVEWKPIDFIGTTALLSGTAENEGDVATIRTPEWKLILTDLRKWSEAEEGKQAEVFGVVRATDEDHVFRVEKGRARLTLLEDQVGREVALRGIAYTKQGEWLFSYRDNVLHVEGLEELIEGNARLYKEPIEITGLLVEAEKSINEQIRKKTGFDYEVRYTVRNANVTAADELLAPELMLDD
jgi:hypothetical protein